MTGGGLVAGHPAVRPLVVGTRGSRLAVAQTDLTVEAIRAHYPDLALSVAVRAISTEGDRSQGTEEPLQELAGRGVFVKDIERALIDGAIDLAVHSLKDLTATPEPGLAIVAVLPREDPRDVLVSREGLPLAELPSGARVGTSSFRRAAQLSALRRDLRFEPIRGNVDTRVRKVETAAYDAAVLAAAGLHRLGLAGHIAEYFSPERCLPDPGQGALAVQIRAADAGLLDLLSPLNHAETWAAVTAERALLAALGGGCKVPIGALGTVEGDKLVLEGLVAAVDGSRILKASGSGPLTDAREIGEALAAELMRRGAGALLQGA